MEDSSAIVFYCVWVWRLKPGGRISIGIIISGPALHASPEVTAHH